ncbi:exo-alpha-sialidase [Nocardioides sp. NPDC057767]|uniref:exo-alpha-sialidase n=1 Tax=unclassified Nocardioides TaxID=2615069 RepID=UPI00366C040E
MSRSTITSRAGVAGAVAAVLIGTTATGSPAVAAPGPDNDARPFWSAQAPHYTEQDLAIGGIGGFPNYRIPALTVAPNGDLLASYDGRPTAIDAPGPNSILQRRSTDGGITWGSQTVVHGGHDGEDKTGYSDPSYVVDRETGSIFNFHVFSMDQGFIGSQPGVDPEDRDVLHAAVSTSDDDGTTWQHRVITAEVTPDLGWRSRFAASGQGIQLRYGPHAGRLVQQFTIINGSGTFQAVSVYSDDHGKTWQAGEAVGTGMDENKTVELSDGTIMLNSRDSAGSKFRKVAYSHDGGETYGKVTIDRELPDPTNNASIVRAFPNAAQGSAEARVLLFSNAASQTGRTNGTVRASCDDGQNWPIAREFQPGPMAYSTLATLPDGDVGLLYEPGHNGIRFAKFNLTWLRGLCAPLTAPELTLERGTSVDSTLTIENQLGPVINPSSLAFEAPAGWTVSASQPGSLPTGESAEVPFTLSVPESAHGGTYRLPVRMRDTAGRTSSGIVTVVVPKLPEEVDGRISVSGGTLTNPKTTPYVVGDRLTFTYRVSNLTDAVTTVVPSGNLRDLDPAVDSRNCRWRNLAAFAAYDCGFPFHVVTQEDLDRGSFTPATTWTSTSGEDVTVVEHTGPVVDLS